MPDLPVMMTCSESHRTGSRPPFALLATPYQTNANGEVTIPNVSLALRFRPLADVGGLYAKPPTVRVAGDRVIYDVAVDRVATVVGIMTNAKGKPVDGQELVLVDPANRATDCYNLPRTSTDSRGKFVFDRLPSGNYEVRFKNGKPKALVAPRIVLRSGEKQTVRVVVP